MTDRIKVFLRVRPTSEGEDEEDGATEVFRWSDRRILPLVGKKNEKEGFLFQRVWGQDADNDQVFGGLCEAVDSVCEGVNATVIAYGHTGAGKTHTMLGTPLEPGMILKALTSLLARQQVLRQQGRGMKVAMSYYEIYMEKVFDLLATGARVAVEAAVPDTPGAAGGAPDIEAMPVTCIEEALDAIRTGQENRRKAQTNLNEHSSRSHTVFQVDVTVGDAGGRQVAGRLQLVDLAGSENSKQAGTTGETQREGGNINKSLLALTNVIYALASRSPHVPYRDSRLTRVLKNSLGGNAKTRIICCIAPTKRFFEEAMSTLLFSERARVIYNAVRTNEVDGSRVVGWEAVQELLSTYQAELDFAEAREAGLAREHREDLLMLQRCCAKEATAEAAVWEELDFAMQQVLATTNGLKRRLATVDAGVAARRRRVEADAKRVEAAQTRLVNSCNKAESLAAKGRAAAAASGESSVVMRHDPFAALADSYLKQQREAEPSTPPAPKPTSTATPRALRTLTAVTTPKGTSKATVRTGTPKTPLSRRVHNVPFATGGCAVTPPPQIQGGPSTPSSSGGKKAPGSAQHRRRRKIIERTENFYPL